MDESGTRLAVFLPDLSEGGAERAMLKLSEELANQKYLVDLVMAKFEGPFVSQAPSNVRIIDLKARNTLSSILALMRYLRKERPAALLASLDRANVVALWARQICGVPRRVVANVQNTMSVEHQHAQNLKARLMPLLVRWTYPWADGIVAVSQGAAEDLAKTAHLPRERVQVIYNPVVGPELLAAAREPLNHPWFRPGEPPVLLTVGRLQPQKDHPTLLRAFSMVRAQRPVRLVILGEGQDRSQTSNLVKELRCEKDVAMPGFVENPYAYMARAAAFVLSSRFEGLPTVIIEALACGATVISTDCPSGPMEILEGGRYGRLVPVGDPEALARAIITVLDSGPAPAPDQSWKPYLVTTVAGDYSRMLLGS